MNGKIMDPIHTRFESILEREFESSHKVIQVTGSSSSSMLGFLLSQSQSVLANAMPHLIIVESEDVATRLAASIKFFTSEKSIHIFPELEASPYSGLLPSPRSVQNRLRFLHHAQKALPGEIFIASANALSQLVLPFFEFCRHSKSIKVGDELPLQLAEFFSFLGYEAAPLVEDPGKFAIRGGIVDCYSPSENFPFRIELFGNQVESIRYFQPKDQRNLETVKEVSLIPSRECLYDNERLEDILKEVRSSLLNRNVDSSEMEELLRSLVLQQNFSGLDFLSSFFYKKLDSAVEYFSQDLFIWILEPASLTTTNDAFIEDIKSEFRGSEDKIIRPEPLRFIQTFDQIPFSDNSRKIILSNLDYLDSKINTDFKVEYKSFPTTEFSSIGNFESIGSEKWLNGIGEKLKKWRHSEYKIFVAVKNQTQAQRLNLYLQQMEFNAPIVESISKDWKDLLQIQEKDSSVIHIILGLLDESIRLDEEGIIFLRDIDFFGKKTRVRESNSVEDFQKAARRLNFGEMAPGDLVVHIKHGVGRYEGLKVMPINGADAEFLQIAYKDSDKLYLPVYRLSSLQKYSGPAPANLLDKLGGTSWSKTKAKVKSHLRDIASELLQLYAKRAELHRSAFLIDSRDTELFAKGFPFDETTDQLRAIRDIEKDLKSTRPMDRLICGDVGFGKTEVAMRAAFYCVQNRKQVAVLAPTTVLTFQHFESFKKRFTGWPVEVRCLNRFVSNADAKKILEEVKSGKADILIGTHRLLSKDIQFKDLGVLIVDEEQKFGVLHKEKIKKLKASVDTIAMSATPIPRTLNMSLMGIRDISLINTAPIDRLPTRTFVCKFNDETIRKAIASEIKRGGQVYFIHNRVQSIYTIADEVRRIVPDARLAVAHGQMDEESLEKNMLAFFHHEIDVLVCTAIVESGMDVTRANTMFIDSAHLFGVSQLYQLRGRVGRSNVRAYCYLMMPANKKIEKDAQDRLKLIQDNTSLGSGIKIAQYDLEMRGAGSILGDEQSGHVDAVGYELYMDLLAEALAEARGEETSDGELDPEINLKVPALIPSDYISDVRLRLGYYKALSDIKSSDDLDQIESELKDQFGNIPDETINLMGIMLLRLQCKKLGVKDLSAGLKAVSLLFTESTPLRPEIAIQLAMRENKKYSLTPDSRLNIRMNQIIWPKVLEELEYLVKVVK